MRNKKVAIHLKSCFVFLTILFFLFSFSGFSLAQGVEPAAKPTIFIYSENDSPLAMDIGGGVGFDNIGLRAGFAINLDMYHVLAGFHYNISLSKQQVEEKSFILGYRFRTYNYMVSAASGICRHKFRCTSGSNYDCYNYKKESINAVPVNFGADWIFTDSFAMGLSFNHVFSKRTDVTALMFCLKFGAFRNIY